MSNYKTNIRRSGTRTDRFYSGSHALVRKEIKCHCGRTYIVSVGQIRKCWHGQENSRYSARRKRDKYPNLHAKTKVSMRKTSNSPTV